MIDYLTHTHPPAMLVLVVGVFAGSMVMTAGLVRRENAWLRWAMVLSGALNIAAIAYRFGPAIGH